MRKKSFKVELLATAMLIALPATAFAENAAVNENGIQEVVVTAQHRRENVQKASVSWCG